MARGKKVLRDEEKAKLIKKLSGIGLSQVQISDVFEMCVPTMLKLYGKEFKKGKAEANANIARTIYQKALEGNVALLIFWAKTQMGWKETNRTEVVSPDGSMAPAAPVVIDFSEINPKDIAILAKAAFRGEAA